MTLSGAARIAKRVLITKAMLESPTAACGFGLAVAPGPNETLQAAVVRVVTTMTPPERVRLKGLVDWAEDFDRAAPAVVEEVPEEAAESMEM